MGHRNRGGTQQEQRGCGDGDYPIMETEHAC
jgi:hypothetical protein